MPEHILSLSYGKDSVACLGAIEQLGWPLDRIVHAEVWATDTIPADLPPMVEFKAKADKIIKERWGIEVEHIRAKRCYEDMFYTVCHGKKSRIAGKIYGWPFQRGPWCNSRLKQSVTNGDKIRSMTDEELREKVWRNMENCEEMAKLTMDTPSEQYWRGCMDALRNVLEWMDEEANENQGWRKICDLQPVDFGPPDTEPRENCIPGKQNPLTLGQLKKMDGQPVWVEEVNHWALIDIEKCGPYNGIPFAVWAENGVKFTYNIRARKLHCYRYQQKEAQE